MSELLDARFLRKLEALSLRARQLAAGRERGERSSRGAGSGIAFASHRAYAPGDDFRFVDWKLFARSERLYVKQFEEARDLTVHLLLDCSASMLHGEGAKLRRARELAAALGYIALTNLDRVQVAPYPAPAQRATSVRGTQRTLVLLRALAELGAGGETDLRHAARTLCAAAPRGGLALVISDGLERASFLEGIDLLRHGRVEPVALLVVDARDGELEARGEVTLIDRESGEQRTVHVSERASARYRLAYRAHLDELLRALAERGVRALALDVHAPLERTVLDLLRRSGVVV